ncbi:MAG: hypothetical protein ACR2P4_10675, partial [Gammaproteobacteria bacterium]
RRRRGFDKVVFSFNNTNPGHFSLCTSRACLCTTLAKVPGTCPYTHKTFVIRPKRRRVLCRLFAVVFCGGGGEKGYWRKWACRIAAA